MISSVVLKKLTTISFIKIEINTKTCKLSLKDAIYNLTPEELEQELNGKHRVYLPCKIVEDVATLYVPMTWDDESIENYTQALMDELYLLEHKLQDYKTIDEIEKSFTLEVILL